MKFLLGLSAIAYSVTVIYATQKAERAATTTTTDSPSLSNKRPRIRGPNTSKVDMTSTDMSPEYRKLFEYATTTHKTYYNIATGKRNPGDRQTYYSKATMPLFGLLKAKEKTLGDKKKTQLYGLANGLTVSHIFSRPESNQVKKQMKETEAALGRKLKGREKMMANKRHAIQLGIATEEWFKNQMALYSKRKDRVEKLASDQLDNIQAIPDSSVGVSHDLSSSRSAQKMEGGSKSMDKENAREKFGERKELRFERMTQRKKGKRIEQVEEIQAMPNERKTASTSVVSPKDHLQHASQSSLWVNVATQPHHDDLYNLFSPPIIDHGSPDQPLIAPYSLDSPKFSGEDLRLPHGLQYSQPDSNTH